MNRTSHSRLTVTFYGVLLFVGHVVFSTPAAAHAPGVVLRGTGVAVIDGFVAPGEWARAGCHDFPVKVPEGGVTPGTVCAMNDATNLYLLIKFKRRLVDPGNSASFEFDNNHDGSFLTDGDDILLINPSIGFFDEVRSTAPPCPPESLCGFFDTTLGGTNDGSGAFGNDGTVTAYEFSHPLDSVDDTNDFSLQHGSTVGFSLFVRILAAGAEFPVGLADTDFPAPPFFGDIVIALPFVHVSIDIKPGSSTNSINARSRGKIPVAILSSSDFNAPVHVDVASLTFGRTGTERSLAFCNAQDVNRDGLEDLLCHFDTQSAAFERGATGGELQGNTITGTRLGGTDSIRVVNGAR